MKKKYILVSILLLAACNLIGEDIVTNISQRDNNISQKNYLKSEIKTLEHKLWVTEQMIDDNEERIERVLRDLKKLKERFDTFGCNNKKRTIDLYLTELKELNTTSQIFKDFQSDYKKTCVGATNE